MGVDLSLNGSRWKLFRSPLRSSDDAAQPDLSSARPYGEVSVPGHVQLQLDLRDPYLDDPAVTSLNDHEWLYVTSFQRPQERGRVFLVFGGVDYFADVWVNGHHVGSHEGAFAAWEIEVTEFVGDENELVVGVSSPWYVNSREHEVHGSFVGSPYAYTTEYLKGDLTIYWDGLPLSGHAVFPLGLWGDVKIAVRSGVELLRATVSTLALLDGEAELQLQCEWWSGEADARPIDMQVLIEPETFSGEAITLPMSVLVEPGYSETRTTFMLRDPELWWTWDMGEQHLYRLTIGDVSTVFGVRTFERDDETFVYSLNGRRLFLRGVWYPFASIFSATPTALEHRRDSAMLRDANVNHIVVHTFIEKEALYDACDRAGILVFQSMPFMQFGPMGANDSAYPRHDEYRATTLSQLEAIVRQCRGHASLGLWAAFAECRKDGEWLFGDYTDFNAAIETIVAEHDPDAIYHPSFCDFGEEHFWQGGFPFGEFTDHYDKNPLHVSEFGAIAPSVVETLREMLPTHSLWGASVEASGRLRLPIDAEEWAFFWSLSYPGFCASVARMYRTVDRSPSTLERFVDAIQWYQGFGLRFCAEAYRRKRFANITGCRTWSYRETHPGMTFTVVDHRQRPKIGYFGLKAGYEPLLLSLDDPSPLASRTTGSMFRHDLWIVNDLPHDEHVDLVARLLDISGAELWRFERAVEVSADSGQVAATLELSLPTEAAPYLLRCEGAGRQADSWLRVVRPAFGERPLRLLLLGQSRYNAPILDALRLIHGIELTIVDESTRDPQDSSWTEDLSQRFDVLWFSGWDTAGHRFQQAEWEALAQGVRVGVGLVHTGGQASFHGGDGRGALLDCTPLGEALPVTLRPHDIVWHPKGDANPATDKDAEFFGALDELPAGAFSRTAARAEAHVHWTIDGFPLLVSGRFGDGHSVAFTGSFTKLLAVVSMGENYAHESLALDSTGAVPYWERDDLKKDNGPHWNGIVQLTLGLLAVASGRELAASPAELADEYQRPLFEELATLPETTLECRVDALDDQGEGDGVFGAVTVRNIGGIIARLVRGRVITSTTNDHRFLDGFVDLLPGETQTLRFEAACKPQELIIEISGQNAKPVQTRCNAP